MNGNNCPPVLFLIFNRPDLTQKVFDRIREARPKKLFIAADGPRQDRQDEYALCEKARKVATEVDWPCEFKTLFREKNLGCGKAVSEAITWFFENVDEGIILEDDCLPNPTFFRFCGELLERFRDDERVVVISGDNYQKQNLCNEQSYYFSINNYSWGWATWRRAWQYYDEELSQWPRLRTTSWLKDILNDSVAARYWQDIFDIVHAGRIDIWDYQWVYSCWIQSGLSVLPSVNLVTNIGYDNRSTHTNNPEGALANLPLMPMEFPLRHPQYMVRNFAADRYDTRHVFSVQSGQAANWSVRVLTILRRGYRRLPDRIRRIIARIRAQGTT
jgi:hypothetical protein